MKFLWDTQDFAVRKTHRSKNLNVSKIANAIEKSKRLNNYLQGMNKNKIPLQAFKNRPAERSDRERPSRRWNNFILTARTSLKLLRQDKTPECPMSVHSFYQQRSNYFKLARDRLTVSYCHFFANCLHKNMLHIKYVGIPMKFHMLVFQSSLLIDIEPKAKYSFVRPPFCFTSSKKKDTLSEPGSSSPTPPSWCQIKFQNPTLRSATVVLTAEVRTTAMSVLLG